MGGLTPPCRSWPVHQLKLASQSGAVRQTATCSQARGFQPHNHEAAEAKRMESTALTSGPSKCQEPQLHVNLHCANQRRASCFAKRNAAIMLEGLAFFCPTIS